MVGYRLKNTVTDNGHVARGVCELNEAKELVGITERTKIEKRDGGIAFSEDDGDMDNYRRRYSCIHEYVGIHKKYFR